MDREEILRQFHIWFVAGMNAEVIDRGTRLVVQFYSDPNLLDLVGLLGDLRASGCPTVTMDKWECGPSDDLVSGPELTLWLPEHLCL